MIVLKSQFASSRMWCSAHPYVCQESTGPHYHTSPRSWNLERAKGPSLQYTVYTCIHTCPICKMRIKYHQTPAHTKYVHIYYSLLSIIIHYFSKIYHYPFVDALIGARIANAQKTSNGIFQLATVPPSGRQLKFKQRKACEPTSPGKLAHYQSLSHCPPGYSIPQHFGSLDQYWKGTFRDVLRVFFFFLDLWVPLLVEQVSAAVRPGLVNVSRGFSPLGSVGPRGRSHHLWTPSHCWLQLPWVRSVLKPWSHNFPPLCIELCNFSILKSQQWKVQMSHFSWLSPVPNPSKVLTTPGSSIAMRYTRTCPATGLKHMINQSKLASVLPLCPWDPTK